MGEETFTDHFRRTHSHLLAPEPANPTNEDTTSLVSDSPPKPVVKIYVRKGDERREDQRRISFRIPDGIDALDLLDKGFAIDGNQAAFTLTPEERTGYYRGPFGVEWEENLDAALVTEQRALVMFLRERGFAPQFT